jgi:hypothetical protein
MKQTDLFYNTTHLKDDELLTEQSNAKSLESKVLQYFKNHPKNAFSWSEVWVSFGIKNHNEVSIKRSITNLFNKGELIKTKMLKKSIYGKSCHLYILNFKK